MALSPSLEAAAAATSPESGQQPDLLDTDVVTFSQPHLAKQDAATVDPTKLTALSPEVVRS